MTLKLYAYSDEKTATVTGNTAETVKIKEQPPAFRVLPDDAFADKTNGLQNKVSLALRRIVDDADNLDSFIVKTPMVPVLIKEVTPYTPYPKLTNYVRKIFDFMSSTIVSGLYTDASSAGVFKVFVNGSLSNITDKNIETAYTVGVYGPGNSNNIIACDMVLGLEFLMPAVNFDYDDIYLGIRAKQTHYDSDDCTITVVAKRFLGATKKLLDESNTSRQIVNENQIVHSYCEYDSIMDDYYSPPQNTGNLNYFVVSKDSGYRTGYTSFKITPEKNNAGTKIGLFLKTSNINSPMNFRGDIESGTNIVKYVTYNNGGSYEGSLTSSAYSGYKVAFIDNLPGSPTYNHVSQLYTIDTMSTSGFTLTENQTFGTGRYIIVIRFIEFEISELCLIYKKTLSIKTELYAPVQGRVFGGPGAGNYARGMVWPVNITDTYGRKFASDLIADPIDLLEHLKRLGNWSETGDCTNVGKEYAPHAKINTSSDIGGFDCAYLQDIRYCRPSFQILDKSDADIISLTKEICRTYFLSSYQDKDGNECILPMDRESFNDICSLNLPQFTYADLYGDISDIEEPDPQNIYCQPVMNYGYNYATGKYDAMLGIINASAPVFNPSYVVGFLSKDATLAQKLWEYCHDLYMEFGNIETPSGDLTDKKMIRSYADAKWYLQNWIWWMRTHRRRFELVTNYDNGSGLYPGMLVSVNLPHQTNGRPQICRVEKVGLSLHKNTATLGLIMIDSVDEV